MAKRIRITVDSARRFEPGTLVLIGGERLYLVVDRTGNDLDLIPLTRWTIWRMRARSVLRRAGWTLADWFTQIRPETHAEKRDRDPA